MGSVSQKAIAAALFAIGAIQSGTVGAQTVDVDEEQWIRERERQWIQEIEERRIQQREQQRIRESENQGREDAHYLEFLRMWDRQLTLDRERLESMMRGDSSDRLGSMPVDRSARWHRDFRSDFQTFLDELAALWFLRSYAPMSEEWARRRLGERSRDLGDALEHIQKYSHLDPDASAIEPLPLQGETLTKRIDQVLVVGRRLATNLVQVTNGAVLDLEVLSAVHSDFVSLEAWTESLQ
jgi:hypothetical protein